jgi:hypothetical protein
VVALFDESQPQPGGRYPDFHPFAVEIAGHGHAHPRDSLHQLGGRALEGAQIAAGRSGFEGGEWDHPFEPGAVLDDFPARMSGQDAVQLVGR